MMSMTAEKYTDLVVAKVKCSKEKKQEIRRQLLTRINDRVAAGEALEKVLEDMGSVKAMADSYNISVSKKERKKGDPVKTLKILAAMAGIVAILGILFAWIWPFQKPIEKSKYFQKEDLESAVIQTISLMDQSDYDTLLDMSNSDMRPYLKNNRMDMSKAQISEDWGERKSIGEITYTQVTQMGKITAMCQVRVEYENVSVSYTISFDRKMKLAGLYLR